MSATKLPRSRSASPEAGTLSIKRMVDTSSEIYRNAMRKLVEAAWRFDKERDEAYLKTLENKQLDRELFRQGIRMSMNCKLSIEEFESLLPHFNNNEWVDGCEFILLFYRIRYEYRSKLLTERIALERKHRETSKEMEVKRLEELAKKVPIKVDFTYTDNDTKTAIAKMTEAAVLYDRSMPGAVQLDAFDCEFMSPDVFNSQIRSCFNMRLSPKELGAFIKYLNKDIPSTEGADDTQVFVYCAPFLVIFFRTGFNERSNRLRAKWQKKKAIEDEKEAKRIADLEHLENKNALKADMSFTLTDKENVQKKLKHYAKLYDKSHPGAMSMSSFDVAYMKPHEFREQLKRVFNLHLSNNELGALISIYDKKKVGLVPCPEFAKSFLAMGFCERDRETKEWLEKQRKLDTQRVVEDEEKKQALANKNSLKFSYTFTDAEYQSAVQKIELAAWRFDKSMPGAASLEAFDTHTMPPHIFKEQAKRAFDMTLTPAELGAVLKYFNADHNGNLVCKDFLNKFLRMGIDDRHRKHAMWLKHDAEVTAIRLKEQENKVRNAESKIFLKDMHDFTESDFQSALAKLTDAATKFTDGSSGLKAFDAISMPPHVFKEQLKLAFNIKLNMHELGALMTYLNKDNPGVVHCKEFLIIFFRTGFEERSRIRATWRKEDMQKKENDIKEEEAKAEENRKKSLSEADYEFTEMDFDSALDKVIDMCRSFDKRQLGPAGFAAFTSESLTPAEFKEMGKRTFNLKVTARELGAIVTYYDVSGKGVVNCNAFLNSFVQIRVQCEEYKGKSNEEKLVHEYHAKLKEAYKLRVQRQMQSNASKLRPWRTSKVAGASGTFNSGSNTSNKKEVKHKRPFPENPEQTLKYRMAAAAHGERLDLSTKGVWDETADKIAELSERLNLNASSLQTSFNLTTSVIATTTAGAIDAGNDIDSVSLSMSLPYFMLHAIPPDVFQMVNLKELWLCNNSISSFPPQIANLVNLQTLSLRKNGLTILPTEICLLESLRALFLTGNKLESLPKQFARLENLKELYLGSNLLTQFPDVVCSCRCLSYLDLSKNQISTVTNTEIAKLQSLTYLSLDKNQIVEAPRVFAKMYWLDVSGCPLPTGVKAACKYKINADDELNIYSLIKRRATAATAKCKKPHK